MLLSKLVKLFAFNGGTLMKMLKLAALSMAVFLYTTTALAQHGHAGAMGGGMGNSMSHASTNTSDHGSASTNAPPTSTQKISNVLAKNPVIGQKIVDLTGDSNGAADACQGFKNIGQCIAAAHVSKNISGLNFYCMRLAMTGTALPPNSNISCNLPSTFKSGVSLGKAIQTFDPQADTKTETKKATTETQQDLKASGVKS
jgi:hypothetical protein